MMTKSRNREPLQNAECIPKKLNQVVQGDELGEDLKGSNGSAYKVLIVEGCEARTPMN